MKISLRTVDVPEFGVPEELPQIPASTYALRCETAYERAGCDWLVIYADREHFANLMFLSGFEPRFEEALLLLGPASTRILVVGNECASYAAIAGLPDLAVRIAQSLSLMGQDRTKQPNLEAVLRDCGMRAGHSIGVVGWKYFGDAEWTGPKVGLSVPHFLVAILEQIAGDPAAVTDKTAVMMDPGTGLRSIVDADQIAAFEWGSSRASTAVWRVVRNARPGDSELEAAARMGYAGEPLSCHMMLASSDASGPLLGLRSPTARTMAHGDCVTTAVGYWGGLSSRAGLVSDGNDEFLQVAKTYFAGLLAWYEAADIGVPGSAVFKATTDTLAMGGLRSALNPGHLGSYDEWSHSPIQPTSSDLIRSGMVFQVDVIPEPMRNGWALNCEDTVAFADERLRAEIASRYPDLDNRIRARRAFLRDALGVEIRESILPLSNIPLCLPPFWLSSDHLLATA